MLWCGARSFSTSIPSLSISCCPLPYLELVPHTTPPRPDGGPCCGVVLGLSTSIPSLHVAPSRILSWYPTLPPTHRCPLLLQPSVRSPIHIPPTSCPRKYRSPPQLLVLLHLHPSPASTSQYRITLRHPLSLRSLLPFPCLSRRPVATPTLPLRALGMFADPFFLRAPPSGSCILHVDNLALLRALCAPDSSAIPHCCHAWSNSACFDPVVPTPYFPGAPPC